MLKLNRKKNRVYLDMAARTPIDEKVLKRIIETYKLIVGNPASVHQEGIQAKNFLASARQTISTVLNTQDENIIFTSGGTEANNLAILGTVLAAKQKIKQPHIITSRIEHPSILGPIKKLQEDGFVVDILEVDTNGRIDLVDLRSKLKPETVLVTFSYVNNEIGTIENIKEVAKILRKFKQEQDRTNYQYPYFHTDASQAVLLELNTLVLGIDLMTIDAGKFYGPGGAGLLFKKKDLQLQPLTFGGGQEQGLRPGTLNPALVVGLAEALKIADKRRKKDVEASTIIQDHFVQKLQTIEGVQINGPKQGRSPNNLNITVQNLDSDVLVLGLDACGVACSAKSACQTDSQASYVLEAIKATSKQISGSLRFSWGRQTAKKDIDKAVSALQKVIKLNT